ncbi:four-helix bundle copper-binding protein [Methylocystis sp. JAN1]|uniref:four-helix bundle copper-binding protein n=1 Tax=Methylocystis sp. JAN1 TaxID=3397211 RepID=UPI003FA1E7DD
MHAQEIIGAHPDVRGQVNGALIHCIEECYDCGQTCISCADACIVEVDVAELRQCIRLNLDCSDLCFATGSIATRRTGSNEELIRSTLESCAIACRLCAEECEKHAARHEHCRVCAEACRRCEEACEGAIRTIGFGH